MFAAVTLGAQLGLFGSDTVAVSADFTGLTRTVLPGAEGDEAWLEHCPGWLSGHERVLEQLVQGVSWRQESRVMYERSVQVPRGAR